MALRLRSIELVYYVMRTGSLRQAAEALNVSQPAASKALHYAEQSLGFALFDRVKGRLVPTREAQIILPRITALFDQFADLSRLAENLRTGRGGHEVVFDMRVQLWNNAETQPIEDASVIWSADEAPFRSVGRLSFPVQNAFNAQRAAFFEDHLVFCPSQGLSAHRPLGSVMRARMRVYEALSAFRHGEKGQDEIQLVSLKQIPA